MPSMPGIGVQTATTLLAEAGQLLTAKDRADCGPTRVWLLSPIRAERQTSIHAQRLQPARPRSLLSLGSRRHAAGLPPAPALSTAQGSWARPRESLAGCLRPASIGPDCHPDFGKITIRLIPELDRGKVFACDHDFTAAAVGTRNPGLAGRLALLRPALAEHFNVCSRRPP